MPFELDDQRLVSAIRQISGTGTHQARDRYAADLVVRFPPAVAPVRSADAAVDLTVIVQAYLQHRGGLSALVDVLADVHGDSPELQRLRWLLNLNDGPPSALTGPQRDRLVALLDDVPREHVEPAVQQAAPRLADVRLGDPPDYERLISDLEDTIASPGAPAPLVAFLEGLSVRLRAGNPAAGEAAIEATSLARSVAHELGVPPSLPDPPGAPPPGAAGASFLVVRLRPDGIDFGRYLMEVWLNTSSDTWERWWFDDNRRLAIEDVEAELNTLIDRRSSAPQSEVNEFIVEFILPPALLEHPVDQWIVNGPGVPAPIGVHFPVVVRDLERMGNQFARARWHQRWNWLSHNGRRVDAEAVFWEWLGGRHEPTELYGQLTRLSDRPVCLVLLKAGGPDQLPGAVKVAVSAGLPAVVWCREGVVETQFDQVMRQLLMGGGLPDLANRIWHLRKDALTHRSAQHVGRHLTLLWDMASRVPPEDSLQVPA